MLVEYQTRSSASALSLLKNDIDLNQMIGKGAALIYNSAATFAHGNSFTRVGTLKFDRFDATNASDWNYTAPNLPSAFEYKYPYHSKYGVFKLQGPP